MKKALFLLLFSLVFTSAALAMPVMSIKQRLRIQLWYQGLEPQPLPLPTQLPETKKRLLPEELERALQKI